MGMAPRLGTRGPDAAAASVLLMQVRSVMPAAPSIRLNAMSRPSLLHTATLTSACKPWARVIAAATTLFASVEGSDRRVFRWGLPHDQSRPLRLERRRRASVHPETTQNDLQDQRC